MYKKEKKGGSIMKAKYFTAESRDAAVAIAVSYFGCNEEDITFEIISEGEEAGACQLEAIVGSKGEIANMDAHYGVFYENDGVYLELYRERGLGNKLDNNDLMQHLSRKNICELNMSAVQALTLATMGRVKIAKPQKEQIYGESISINITADEQSVSATLYAPEPGGPMLSIEAARKKLSEAGVTHGLDEQALSMFLEEKDYGHPHVVAIATPAEDGIDGKLIFNFSTDERTGCPREIGGGRVDYRSLDLYVSVEQGQLLITRVPATEGMPGTSVKGKIIKQKPGKDVAFPRGKNVEISQEKTEMRALCSGMVEFINNSVNVSSVYNIKGDCDLSVGNIDFDGSVHISGNVRSGSVVKATGAIVVGGSVEAATIIAGGNVEVKGGMQGGDKGLIEAGGSVNILYVERGTVLADGPVTVDVSIHSFIETAHTLTAKGKRGAIIGGRVGSSGNIIANYIGALSNTRTEVVVGVMQRKRARLQFLEKEIERLPREQDKLDKLDAYLRKTKDTMEPEKWELLHRSGIENRRLNNEYLEDCKFEINKLTYELENSTEGRIHVFNTVFSGSRVLIGSDTYVVNDDINYVSFRYSDKQVVYGPCEITQDKKSA